MLPHSLHVLLMRWCWHKPAPPHSLHWLLMRWCGQMLAPPHSLHWLFMRSCGQMPESPHSLHWLLWRWCGHFEGSFLRAPLPGFDATPPPPLGCFVATPPPSAGSVAAGRFFPAGPGAELISERPRRSHLSVGAPVMLLSAALVTSPPLRLQCLHARVSVSRRRERVVSTVPVTSQSSSVCCQPGIFTPFSSPHERQRTTWHPFTTHRLCEHQAALWHWQREPV